MENLLQILGFGFWLILFILVISGQVAWCFLCKRLGYDAMLGLVMLIPIANLVLFFCLAFRESPLEKKYEALKRRRLREQRPLVGVPRDKPPVAAVQPPIVVDDPN